MPSEEYPAYTPWEMAIREGQSEPLPLRDCFKDLAKRFQAHCEISNDRDRNRKKEIRNLKKENREMAGNMMAMANAIAELEAGQ